MIRARVLLLTVLLLGCAVTNAQITWSPPQLPCPEQNAQLKITFPGAQPTDDVDLTFTAQSLLLNGTTKWPKGKGSYTVSLKTSADQCGKTAELKLGANKKDIPIAVAASQGNTGQGGVTARKTVEEKPQSKGESNAAPSSVEPRSLVCGQANMLVAHGFAFAPHSETGEAIAFYAVMEGTWTAIYTPECRLRDRSVSFRADDGKPVEIAIAGSLQPLALPVIVVFLLIATICAVALRVAAKDKHMADMKGMVDNRIRFEMLNPEGLQARVASLETDVQRLKGPTPNFKSPPAESDSQKSLPETSFAPAPLVIPAPQIHRYDTRVKDDPYQILFDRYQSAIATKTPFPLEPYGAELLCIRNANERASRGDDPQYAPDEKKGDLLAIRINRVGPAGRSVDSEDLYYIFPIPDVEKWKKSRIDNSGWDFFFTLNRSVGTNSLVAPARARLSGVKWEVQEKGELNLTF